MHNRRDFIKKGSTLSASTLLIPTLLGAKVHQPQLVLKAKALKKGAVVGLIAPGYAISAEKLRKAKESLRSMGFIPYHTDRILVGHGYFSNTDQERIKDLHEMFLDPKVDAILCARGGYGCTRLLADIDYNIIKTHPKIFIGFSDITALLNAFYQKTGLIGYHGPVGTTLADEYGKKWLKKVVMDTAQFPLEIKNASLSLVADSEASKTQYKAYTLQAGKATGLLTGGSLSLVTALIGTPFEPNFTNSIICLEDVGEAPYRIDRMLTQLLDSKTFKNAAAIALGVFNDCDKEPSADTFTLKQVLKDRLSSLGIPVYYGLSFGHVDQNFTFPIGIKATLDTQKGTLTIEEKPTL